MKHRVGTRQLSERFPGVPQTLNLGAGLFVEPRKWHLVPSGLGPSLSKEEGNRWNGGSIMRDVRQSIPGTHT